MAAVPPGPWPYEANSSAANYRFTLPSGYPLSTDNPFFVGGEIVWAVGQHAQMWSGLISEGYSFSTYYRDMSLFFSVTGQDLLYFGFLAFAWTLLRIFLYKAVFYPFGRYVKLQEADMAKCAESLWKFVAYLGLWILTVYTLFGNGNEVFWDPLHLFQGHKYHVELPAIGRTILSVQMGFYMHSIFGTAFMDVKKKDYIAFMVHHIVTSVCILFAYSLGYWKATALCLLIDITDIFLEIGKFCVCMRKRVGAKDQEMWNNLASAGAALFGISWVLFRLWFYWTRLLRASLVGTLVETGSHFPLPFALTENFFLVLIYVLNWYWFSFIMEFVVKAVKGEVTEVDDTREHDADFGEQSNKSSSSNEMRNGRQKKE